MSNEERTEGLPGGDLPDAVAETDLVPFEEQELAPRKKKEARLYPAKKLPPLLRKSFSERALNARVLKKLYVPQDRADMGALFVQGANPKKPKRYAIPAERTFTKKELSRYRRLAREIKRQKGRVRLVPLAAIAGMVAAVVTVVGIFKNPLVKKGLIAACQSVFHAKTEIGSVNLRILGASLTVRDLAIGNKNSVMKNLFEAEKIELDFSLIQALRGKFDAQNIEVSGMDFNTDRTTSCYIPYDDTPIAETPFVKELRARSENALEDLKAQAAELLGGSDVDSIVANVLANIRTPEAAQQALETSQALIEKWKEKPGELKTQVTDFADTVKELQRFDVAAFRVQSMEDLDNLRTELEKVNTVVEASKTLKAQAEAVVQEVRTDAQAVQQIAMDVAEAAKNDIDYAQDRLTTITGAITNAQQLFTNALDTVAYNLLGTYYPYAQQAIAYATKLKAQADALQESPQATAKKEKKAGRKRMEGTTFWYTTEYPSFLIERVFASGPGFSAKLAEITNDQDKRNIPTTGTATFQFSGITHDAGFTVDARSQSADPLIALRYTGSGFTTRFDGTRVATLSGVPSLDGGAVLSLGATADATGFTAQGAVSLNPLSLTTDGFANATVTKYYRQALAEVTSLNVGYDVGYTEARGLFLDLSGNFAEQFVNSLKAVALSIGRDAKDAALKRIQDELNASSNEVLLKAKEFLGIEGDIDLQNLQLSDLQGIVESKRAELEKRIKAEAERLVDTAKAKATEAVTEAAKEAESQATSAIKDAIQGALGTDGDDSAASDAADAATDALKNAAESFLRGFGRN